MPDTTSVRSARSASTSKAKTRSRPGTHATSATTGSAAPMRVIGMRVDAVIGAIQKIDEKEKMGIGQKPISIGTAMYDHGRCLPWAMATPCIVCEEFCPTSPKAIWAEDVDVPKRDSKYEEKGEKAKMLTVHVQRPHVDPSLCIGCGACEKVCPIVDKPAVYVTNAGETRSKTNVILLENTSYSQKS